MSRKVVIFGSTGSIGQNTLEVLRHEGNSVDNKILAMTANNNIEQLCKDAKEFSPERVVTANESKYFELKEMLCNYNIEVCAGKEALIECAQMGADWTMASIVGFDGLAPSLASVSHGGVLALANKESLVCAGDFFMKKVRESGSTLLPVDSEHNAIFQCLNKEPLESVEKIIITASGGPFRNWSSEKMLSANLKQALSHPNWSMGNRISIDSASMFNKAMELIEAKHLFDIKPSKLEVVIHPESIIHSMVNFCDGSIIAQLGAHDMKGAIGYTLNYPVRKPVGVANLDFFKLKKLTFEKPDTKKFPALKMAEEVMAKGGALGVVFNAAKEIALDRFISGEISFMDMNELVERVLNLPQILALDNNSITSFEDIEEINSFARRLASQITFIN